MFRSLLHMALSFITIIMSNLCLQAFFSSF